MDTRLDIADHLEVAATSHRTNIQALGLAQAAAVTLPSSTVAHGGDSDDEAHAPSEASPLPVELDLSNPAGAVELLRSFDHCGFLTATEKTRSTIRRWHRT